MSATHPCKPNLVPIVPEPLSSFEADVACRCSLQVVVNLYPFRATVTADPAPAFEVGVENIDIGGPAMIRAAAKNHQDVAVVVDPADYDELLAKLGGAASEEEMLAFKKKLAWKAYQHTASYDAQVGGGMWRWEGGEGGVSRRAGLGWRW